MARFIIFRDVVGQYRWRLIAANGEIIANSESYTTIYSAKRSAERVKQLAAYATII